MRRGVLALAMAGAASPVAAQPAPDLGAYCRVAYGAESRPALRRQGEAYAWACLVGNARTTLVLNHVCEVQHGPGARAVNPTPADPHAWRCAR